MPLPRAWSLLRAQPWYRREAFDRGLRAAGYEVQSNAASGRPGDVLLIWNRYGGHHDIATRWEKEGGTVLVAENGYLGAGGTAPKFDVHPGGPQPHHYYALAKGWHNGRGNLAEGDGSRWQALGVELKPWRVTGDHILVAANRSFGVAPQIMPPDWPQRCAERLGRATGRPVRVRVHPGNDAPNRPLRADLENAWAVVIWSSGVAVHALAAGIPVFIEAPFHIVKGAQASGSLDEPVMPERLPHLERMAWAQWTCREIESGEPFRSLLSPARQTAIA